MSLLRAIEWTDEFPLDAGPLPVFAAPARPSAPASIADTLARSMRTLSELEGEAAELREKVAEGDPVQRMVKQLVPFVDALDRLIHMGRTHADAEAIAPWIDGLDSAFDRLSRTFERFGAILDGKPGEPVDLARHEVVEYRPTKDHPHDTVIEVTQRGILYKGKSLRDARVIVACNPD